MDKFLPKIDDLLKNAFKTLKSSSERIDKALDEIDSISFLRQNMHRFMTDHKSRNRKSLFKSQEYRNNGNRYHQKNYEYALYFYNLVSFGSNYSKLTLNLFSKNCLSF
jgi:hypothetical protein